MNGPRRRHQNLRNQFCWFCSHGNRRSFMFVAHPSATNMPGCPDDPMMAAGAASGWNADGKMAWWKTKANSGSYATNVAYCWR